PACSSCGAAGKSAAQANATSDRRHKTRFMSGSKGWNIFCRKTGPLYFAGHDSRRKLPKLTAATSGEPVIGLEVGNSLLTRTFGGTCNDRQFLADIVLHRDARHQPACG